MAKNQIDLFGKAMKVVRDNAKNTNSFEWDTKFYNFEENEQIIGIYKGIDVAKKGKFSAEYLKVLVKTDETNNEINVFLSASLHTQINKLAFKPNDIIMITFLGKKEFDGKSVNCFVVGKYIESLNTFVSCNNKKLF